MGIQEHQRDRYCQKVKRKNLMGCVFKPGEQACEQVLKINSARQIMLSYWFNRPRLNRNVW